MTNNPNTAGEYASLIFKRLFGRTGTYVMPQTSVVVRPVGMIVEDLVTLSDMEWANYAISNEPLEGRFDSDLRNELFRKAFDCGQEMAENIASKYGRRDPKEIAKAAGLTVKYPFQPQNAGRVLFAEFFLPDEIRVYQDAIDKAKWRFEEPGVTEALGEIRLENLLIAHELFHYFEEEQKNEIWTRTYRFDMKVFGFLKNSARVVTLSEIAAMGFCKRLNKLPYAPYVMDAFLVYGYNAEHASRLYQSMMTKAGRVPRVPGNTETDPESDAEKDARKLIQKQADSKPQSGENQ